VAIVDEASDADEYSIHLIGGNQFERVEANLNAAKTEDLKRIIWIDKHLAPSTSAKNPVEEKFIGRHRGICD